MSILLFFLLGIALLGFAVFFIIVNNDPAQWWVWLVLLLCGLGAIARALYGLNEETGCLSNLFKKKKKKQPASSSSQKPLAPPSVNLPAPRKTKIDLTKMMLYAHEMRKKCTDEQYEEKIKNLLSPAFAEYKKIFKDFCALQKIAYDQDLLFNAYQHLFILLIKCNDSFSRPEYEAYKKFCHWAGIEPLTAARIDEFYTQQLHSNDTWLDALCLLIAMRPYIDPENYAAMVQGFCFLALLDNHVYHENHYYVLRCFFEKGFDKCPNTWEEQKNEY